MTASATTRLFTELASSNTLTVLSKELRHTNISRLFGKDEQQVRGLTLGAAGLTLDYSKQLLDRQTRAALDQLAGLKPKLASFTPLEREVLQS